MSTDTDKLREDDGLELPIERLARTEIVTRWAVNVLLEQIACKFEANDTWDVLKSDAAALVRSFKHDLASQAGPPTLLSEGERKIIEKWRPSETNPICQCHGGSVCGYHALTAIIDRLTND